MIEDDDTDPAELDTLNIAYWKAGRAMNDALRKIESRMREQWPEGSTVRWLFSDREYKLTGIVCGIVAAKGGVGEPLFPEPKLKVFMSGKSAETVAATACVIEVSYSDCIRGGMKVVKR